MSETADVEGLLRRALAPVEPPEDLATRLRGALHNITELAAGELDGWELSAMRDPRKWWRPAAAVVGGGLAGGVLLLLRIQRRGRGQSPGGDVESSPATRLRGWR